MGTLQQGDPSDDAWARSVVAGIIAPREAIDHALVTVLNGSPVVSEENAIRRADAVRAAALGLPLAACAAVAGVSGNLLDRWLEENPGFRAAMTSAHAMAGTPGGEIDQTEFSAASLHQFLRALAFGATVVDATAQVGRTRFGLRQLRERNPRVNALLNAATAQRRQTAGRKRRLPGTEAEAGAKYRLVQRDEL
ncbi:hypothetical protein ACWFRJ_03710 [Streptomyces sp. NPDC055239]